VRIYYISEKYKMKKAKLILIASFTVLFAISANAQKGESDKCVGEGTFIADAYYGYPFLAGNFIKDYYTNSYSGAPSNEKVVNYNHVGGKFEYMINDMVGMGVDYTYAKAIYTYTDSYYTSASGLSYGKFTESVTKQRFLLRVNIHFATSRELDPYATAGFGYKQTVSKTDNIYNNQLDWGIFNALPVAFRVGAGLRWFFTDNIGVCIEAGVGGPVIQGGLCAKF
jgi:opacity protein-like surface antigen